MLAPSVFLAHAPADHTFASDLAQFLERGCDVRCELDEAQLRPGEDLVEKIEQGLGSDVLVIILSPDLSPGPVPRSRWEPVLVDERRTLNATVLVIVLGDGWFPAQVRRALPTFDARKERLNSFRWIKRRLWGRHRSNLLAAAGWSLEVEPLYTRLADQPGLLTVSASEARLFAEEAEGEFELVVWAHCENRSLAQVAGQIGSQLGVPLDGPVAQDLVQLCRIVQERRLLLVLDAPDSKCEQAFAAGGRSSYLITTEPVGPDRQPDSVSLVRELLDSRRIAEAYEMLERLLEVGMESEFCAREMIRILEDWGRFDYARLLRDQFQPMHERQMAFPFT